MQLKAVRIGSKVKMGDEVDALVPAEKRRRGVRGKEGRRRRVRVGRGAGILLLARQRVTLLFQEFLAN